MSADFEAVIVAIGMRSYLPREEVPGIFYAGDMANGPKTVVEAVASGKNAALEIDAYLKKQAKAGIQESDQILLHIARLSTPCLFPWKQISSGERSARPTCSPPPP